MSVFNKKFPRLIFIQHPTYEEMISREKNGESHKSY